MWEENNINFIKGSYTYSNSRTISPYSIHLKLEKGDEYKKAHLILNYNYHLNQEKRLQIRGYCGFVETTNPVYNIEMSESFGKDVVESFIKLRNS